jgi:hypothetical protein
MSRLAVLAAGAPGAMAFLQSYAWHWSGGHWPGGEQRRSRLTAMARTRCGNAAAWLARTDADEPIDGFLSALDDLLGEADRADVGVGREQLCFHHLHLTNNRLGIAVGAEAYLALLLIQHWTRHPEHFGEPRLAPVPA